MYFCACSRFFARFLAFSPGSRVVVVVAVVVAAAVVVVDDAVFHNRANHTPCLDHLPFSEMGRMLTC